MKIQPVDRGNPIDMRTGEQIPEIVLGNKAKRRGRGRPPGAKNKAPGRRQPNVTFDDLKRRAREAGEVVHAYHRQGENLSGAGLRDLYRRLPASAKTTLKQAGIATLKSLGLNKTAEAAQVLFPSAEFAPALRSAVANKSFANIRKVWAAAPEPIKKRLRDAGISSALALGTAIASRISGGGIQEGGFLPGTKPKQPRASVLRVPKTKQPRMSGAVGADVLGQTGSLLGTRVTAGSSGARRASTLKVPKMSKTERRLRAKSQQAIAEAKSEQLSKMHQAVLDAQPEDVVEQLKGLHEDVQTLIAGYRGVSPTPSDVDAVGDVAEHLQDNQDILDDDFERSRGRVPGDEDDGFMTPDEQGTELDTPPGTTQKCPPGRVRRNGACVVERETTGRDPEYPISEGESEPADQSRRKRRSVSTKKVVGGVSAVAAAAAAAYLLRNEAQREQLFRTLGENVSGPAKQGLKRLGSAARSRVSSVLSKIASLASRSERGDALPVGRVSQDVLNDDDVDVISPKDDPLIDLRAPGALGEYSSRLGQFQDETGRTTSSQGMFPEGTPRRYETSAGPGLRNIFKRRGGRATDPDDFPELANVTARARKPINVTVVNPTPDFDEIPFDAGDVSDESNLWLGVDGEPETALPEDVLNALDSTSGRLSPEDSVLFDRITSPDVSQRQFDEGINQLIGSARRDSIDDIFAPFEGRSGPNPLADERGDGLPKLSELQPAARKMLMQHGLSRALSFTGIMGLAGIGHPAGTKVVEMLRSGQRGAGLRSAISKATGVVRKMIRKGVANYKAMTPAQKTKLKKRIAIAKAVGLGAIGLYKARGKTNKQLEKPQQLGKKNMATDFRAANEGMGLEDSAMAMGRMAMDMADEGRRGDALRAIKKARKRIDQAETYCRNKKCKRGKK